MFDVKPTAYFNSNKKQYYTLPIKNAKICKYT